jgi:hypothetical protein
VNDEIGADDQDAEAAIPGGMTRPRGSDPVERNDITAERERDLAGSCSLPS